MNYDDTAMDKLAAAATIEDLSNLTKPSALQSGVRH